MNALTISTVQFESRNGSKDYNLSVIENFTARASASGSKVIAFHECCITGYTFARSLSKDQMLDLAEYIPDGESIGRVGEIALKYNMVILAGLFEKDSDDNLFNTYFCTDGKGLFAKFRKLHPFINPFLSSGQQYCIFDIYGWKCGILICYDNNIIENVRATRLLGADIIFMPHVTMCTPSARPGSGYIDPMLWLNREADPSGLRLEFDGPKGREWLMKWLPSRAYDNAVYVVFSNTVGMDDDQVKNGCSMIVDPFGDILAECRNLGDDMVSATITPEKLSLAGGYRYLNARRPEIYREIIGQVHDSELQIYWLKEKVNNNFNFET